MESDQACYYKYSNIDETFNQYKIKIVGNKQTGKTKFLDIIMEHQVDIADYIPTLSIDHRIGSFNESEFKCTILFKEYGASYIDLIGGEKSQKFKELFTFTNSIKIIVNFIDLEMLVKLQSESYSNTEKQIRTNLSLSKNDILLFVFCENHFVKEKALKDKSFNYSSIIKQAKENNKNVFYIDFNLISTVNYFMTNLFRHCKNKY